MPLFSKRSRSLSTTRGMQQPPAASSSAHQAAAQAFLANRQAQTNLSTSAAAAALRSMTPTPIPVEQTKRAQRRSSSASLANAPRGRSRGGVQRENSSGSMTERTFRSPSPGRPAVIQEREFEPPVPPVPQNYATTPPVPRKSNKRSASLEAPPPRMMSPAMNKSTDKPQGQATAAARRVTSLQGPYALERSDSNNSINFSYPRGSRPNSPPPKPSNLKNGDDASSRNGISRAEAERIQNELNQVAQKPVKKSKRQVDKQLIEGSHLQTGSMGSKPTVTPLEPGPVSSPTTQSQDTAKPKKKSAALTGQATHFPESPSSQTSADSDSESPPDRQKDRRAQRASGVLLKQPSVVREDWEGEQEEHARPSIDEQGMARATSPIPIALGKRTAAEANVSRKIEEPVSSPNATSGSMVHEAVTMPTASSMANISPAQGSQTARGPSLSPSRSTRFSNRLSSDITVGGIHHPLPRSVSPAKSALKHHSPSPSGTSPITTDFSKRRDSSVTPSEGTDISVDAPTKRKKSARVSFEADPETVGTAAETQLPNTPTLLNPQNKDSGKKSSWSGKHKGSSLGSIPAEEEMEEAMQPRPPLPTFGSVRKTLQDGEPTNEDIKRSSRSHQSSTTASSNSSVSSTSDIQTMETSVSSDQALGNLLHKDAHQRELNGNTKAPGFSGDSGLAQDQEHRSFYSNVTQDHDVPMIAVQPATPGPEEFQNSQDQWLVPVPGGFPTSSEHFDGSENSRKALGADSAQAHRSALDALVREQADERDSDNESIYSDAAEDLSDLEGDGFGSINAIVRSPLPTSPAAKPVSPMASPVTEEPVINKRPQESQRSASWEDAEAHWKSLAQQVKREAVQPSAQPDATIAEEPVAPKPKKRTQTSTITAPALAARSAAKVDSTSSTPRQTVVQPPAASRPAPPGDQSSYRRSTRTDTEAGPAKGFKSSMRSEGESGSSGGFRSSMRSEPPISAASKGFRSSMRSSSETQRSYQEPTYRSSQVAAPASPIPEPRATLQKKSVPAATTAPRRPLPPINDDSDSESSFRKHRKAKKENDGRYSMKKSMRSGPASRVEAEPPKAPVGRGGVRSLSPVARRPFSPAGMRSSMRGSAEAGTPTLRPQPQQRRSSSLFGRNKNKSPQRAAPSVPVASKLKSRVADSDDEDGPRPTTFRSRFEDSSDDEPSPTKFTPVRGIPRRGDEADSTDLEDSSDDGTKRTKAAPPKKLTIQPPTDYGAVDIPASPSSPTSKKKRGLFGRFRKQKEEGMPSSPASQTIAERNGFKAELDQAKTIKSKPSQLGFNSKAEQEATIARVQQQLEADRARPTSPSPLAGKLQRRGTPQRVMSDSWPLPPKMPAAQDNRPSTADAIDDTPSVYSRPGAGGRQPTSETLLTTGGTPIYGKSGKKKRFPMLRKAFGLTD